VSAPRILLIVTIGAALAGFGAGCGSSSSSSSDSSSTAKWADGICTAVVTWKNELTSIGASLKGKVPTQASVEAAANKAQTATQTFADTVKSLGKPDTTSGSAASDAVTQLDDELTAGASSIEDAVKGVSGVNATLAAVSSVSGTLATMGTQVSATVTTLQQLDAKGELENAFSQSSACQSLKQKS